jgi:hypothetical protein
VDSTGCPARFGITHSSDWRERDRQPSAFLFFQRHSNSADGREAHLVAFNACDEAPVDIMVVSLVRPFSTILFRQLDTAAFHSVDGADVDAVGADHFHVLFDFSHWGILCEQKQRAWRPNVHFDRL